MTDGGSYQFPPPMPFVPSDLSIKSKAISISLWSFMPKPQDLNLVSDNNCLFQVDSFEVPTKVRDDYAVQVFYLLPSNFAQPKASVYLVLGSPLAYSSPRNFVLNQILTELLEDQLSDYVYSASLAGVTITLTADRKGVVVCVPFPIRVVPFPFTSNLLEQVKIEGFNDHIIDVIRELGHLKNGLVLSEGSFQAARISV